MITNQEFKLAMDNGIVKHPVRVGRFYCQAGGCNLWFSCLDLHHVMYPQYNGKRSEWLQKRMISWANLVSRYDLPEQTIRKSQLQKEMLLIHRECCHSMALAALVCWQFLAPWVAPSHVLEASLRWTLAGCARNVCVL